ncbi:MAG TPA: hypothetical protein VMH88_04475 [Gemmatimonadales bacterium]|nr:hypothetical protein [Gemmatimonadales bacterium]
MTRRLVLLVGLVLLAACNQGLQPRPASLQPTPARADSTHSLRP